MEMGSLTEDLDLLWGRQNLTVNNIALMWIHELQVKYLTFEGRTSSPHFYLRAGGQKGRHQGLLIPEGQNSN